MSAPAATTLIVFAKAPEPGRVKTRLVPALGEAGAAALAARLLVRAVEAAVDAGFADIELCTAPDAGHPAFEALASRPGVRLAVQGEGDLGQRMQRALHRALQRGRPALLIGTDAPALDAPMLQRAAEALAGHEAVFVPALDGGYVLVGLSRPAPALFEGIAWSTPQVMAQTRERAIGLRVAELPAVPDIDVPADLVHLPAEWLT